MLHRNCLPRTSRALGRLGRHQTRAFTVSGAVFRPAAPLPPSPAAKAGNRASANPSSNSSGKPKVRSLLKPPASLSSPPRSVCPAGTVLSGLNYFKDRPEIVALDDQEYPEWLWHMLDPAEQESGVLDFGDEYAKSAKQRKLALKKRREFEDTARAEGNFAALLPKIPLHQQTVNLPDGGAGSIEEAIAAAEARIELQRALSRDHARRIKAQNYLKTL